MINYTKKTTQENSANLDQVYPSYLKAAIFGTIRGWDQTIHIISLQWSKSH